MASNEAMKEKAAQRALSEVRAGMRLGLGTGSTAALFIAGLGRLVAQGLDVICVPTSEKSHAQAESLGIKLTTLDETPELDLGIDGADEIGPALSLIKGAGGALLREKIVAAACKRFVVIADDSKVVATLGRFPLPIEIIPFGARVTRQAIIDVARGLGLSGEIKLRSRPDGATFVTDGGHFIFDAAFGAIPEPDALALRLNQIPGVVEHGLFLGMAQQAYVAGADGVAEMTLT